MGRRTPRGILLDLPISRGELADLVGIALATASRFFHELRKLGSSGPEGGVYLIMRSKQLAKENGEIP